MIPSLSIAVSPYHLATREPAAMTAMVLGARVITLLPFPAAGVDKQTVRAAVDHAPRYLRLLESWRWTTPVWRAGVLSAVSGGEAACRDLPGVFDHIRSGDSFSELRPLTREVEALRDSNDARYLDALSNDLLRGGPDPGISIPINAALERFAARHGFVLARGPVSSVAQRAESRLGDRAFSIGLPMLLQAGGQRILALREDLEAPLNQVRSAIVSLLLCSADLAATNLEALQESVRNYTTEFNDWMDAGFAGGDDETGLRVRSGFVGLTCLRMPADSVLRSSRAVVRSMVGASRAREAEPSPELGPPAAPADSESSLGRFTLIVREMTARPEV